jgi:uncharacterized protein YbjT (DUF2867 family)
MGAVYVTSHPDLMVPWAAPAIRAFCERAVARGVRRVVRRVVLLSGRGEPAAAVSERVVRASGAEWTVLRASWFFQNFSEDFLLGLVLDGEIALPAGEVAEPFVDADEVTEVAVVALTTDALAGRTVELTSPRLLTFAGVAAEISSATGRDVHYRPVSARELVRLATASDEAAVLAELFTRVLDGRNSAVTADVARVLGRPARDFADYARAAAGAWAR